MEDIKEYLSKSPTAAHWKKIGIFHHYGVDILLSALRSKESCGIGEFLDLVPIIDWCKELRMDVIQLLPLNDIEIDPSPYNGISAFAINPIFLSLYAVPFLEECPTLKKKLSAIRIFNEKQKVAYHEVQSHKMAWLVEYIEKVESKLINSRSFNEFIKENDWLQPYALFKVLKRELGNNSWYTWPKELRKPSKEEFQKLQEKYEKELNFFILLQYLCYSQLKAVKDYGISQNVLIMGDIPILISRDSADVWQYPELFNLGLSAGAPPDFYAPKGQNWGFPVFNWEEKKKTQYSWWKKRLAYAANFYDLFRIDHTVGMFRIWAIPLDRPPLEGSFIPPDESEWLPQGRDVLEMMINCTTMLPIAEDLGTVPSIVRKCLFEYGIPGTKVMRWERRWDNAQDFVPIEEYPPISMTTVSTHDSQTLEQWWKECLDEANALAEYKKWDYLPDLTSQQRKEILWDSNHTTSLFHINLLQEYLALFPELIWENPQDERINVPGEELPTNWTYRYRPSVEEIVMHLPLRTEMEKIFFNPRPPE